jgi:hypothetical protein
MGYKPDGYTSVAPYLIVSGAAKTISFLERVFDRSDPAFPGPPVRSYTPGPAGRPVGCWPTASRRRRRPHVHVYVPDVDAAYRRAGAGASSVQKPIRRTIPTSAAASWTGGRRGGFDGVDSRKL